MNSTNVLVVTGFVLCGWPIVGTNFSEWVQIFQKNVFQEDPILGGVKIKRDNSTCSFVCSIIEHGSYYPRKPEPFRAVPIAFSILHVMLEWTIQELTLHGSMCICRHVACGIRALRLIYLFTLSLVKAVHAIELPPLAARPFPSRSTDCFQCMSS